MLGLGRYLLGVIELLWLAGFATLGASSIRKWLVPDLSGASSLLATMVLAAALLIWPAELLGTFGAFEALPFLALVGALGVSSLWLLRRVAEDEGGRERTLGPPAGPPQTATGPLR